ncbi:MAG TPA: flagellar basal body-associated FliL family protein [Burkholderiales bacterium]|nr:flagellar basal body-associated FliL family protein [Burkholderiales bacterium]
MSNEAKETANEADGAVKGGSKKKVLLLVIAGLVVALGGGGGSAWFVLHKKAGHGAEAAAKPKPHTTPIFVTLEPFVVNLAGDVQRYLQVGIDLKVAEAKIGDDIKAHLPEIRNGVLMLLSSKQVDELATAEGKNRLRQEIRSVVNKPLGFEPNAPAAPAAAPQSASGEAHAAEKAPAEQSKPPAAEEPSEGVLDVLLTSFVIQ